MDGWGTYLGWGGVLNLDGEGVPTLAGGRGHLPLTGEYLPWTEWRGYLPLTGVGGT